MSVKQNYPSWWITCRGLFQAKELGCADKQVTQRWANNRVENSHLPFQRREGTILRFRCMHNLPKYQGRKDCHPSLGII